MPGLSEFIAANTQEIITRARAKVAKRSSPAPTDEELTEGVPLFLTQLIDRLRLSTMDNGELEASAARHGAALQRMGVTVAQVVHDYGDVCQAVTELAEVLDAQITTHEFHTLNGCLDDAIAHAVSEYARQREQSITNDGTERLGSLAHELRNRLAAAMLSFNILKKGNVALGGSTGAILGRSLRGLGDIVNRSLAEARLESGIQRRQPVSVFELLEEIQVEAAMDASVRGVELVVAPGERGVDVEADPQIIAAAIGNLVQNAIKFSRPNGHVSLRATATPDRVTIEIEDECGGLPPGMVETLFLPFTQKGKNRTGLGLGLAISRKGVAATDGTIRVRDLPGKGCVFAVELPRLAHPGAQSPKK